MSTSNLENIDIKSMQKLLQLAETLNDIQNKENEEKETNKKKSPYQRFLQVNEERYNDEDWLIKNNPAAYRVLRFLTKNMDNYNAVICSYATMAEILGYSRPTLSSAIKLLKEKKYIDVVRTGGSNVYLINKELYWHSYGNNYQYAEFGAKIIISSSEQDQNIEKVNNNNNKEIKIKRYNQIEIEKKEDKKTAL